MPGNTAYCLSKGGMRMLTRTAGIELAPHNILVVGVGPGAVATPINLSTMKDPALLKKLDDAIPLGRMAKPEEIASVVAFLAGEGASYMTATTIFTDGGIMHSSPGCRKQARSRFNVPGSTPVLSKCEGSRSFVGFGTSFEHLNFTIAAIDLEDTPRSIDVRRNQDNG